MNKLIKSGRITELESYEILQIKNPLSPRMPIDSFVISLPKALGMTTGTFDGVDLNELSEDIKLNELSSLITIYAEYSKGDFVSFNTTKGVIRGLATVLPEPPYILGQTGLEELNLELKKYAHFVKGEVFRTLIYKNGVVTSNELHYESTDKIINNFTKKVKTS